MKNNNLLLGKKFFSIVLTGFLLLQPFAGIAAIQVTSSGSTDDYTWDYSSDSDYDSESTSDYDWYYGSEDDEESTSDYEWSYSSDSDESTSDYDWYYYSSDDESNSDYEWYYSSDSDESTSDYDWYYSSEDDSTDSNWSYQSDDNSTGDDFYYYSDEDPNNNYDSNDSYDSNGQSYVENDDCNDCWDECAYVGKKEYSGNSYRICGDYDSDCCLEWSSWHTNDPDPCDSHEDKKCYSNDVYWYDSCGEREEKYEECGSDSWTNDYRCSGNTVQRKKIERGCSCGSCYEEESWIDYQDCSDSGKVCQSGQCVALSPSVDIKANGSDGPITIDYNNSANLNWTSENVNSCYASGDWSGSKSTSGSQSTGSLYSSKTYTINCSGSGGSSSDSVTVNVHSQPTLSVYLQSIPSSGEAPLYDVDLKATVSGTAQGSINYKFDCTNNGIWDKQISGINSNPYTAVNVCDYPSSGTYTARVRVERDGVSAEDTDSIHVYENKTNPPIADAGPDREVYENESITLYGNGYDPDGGSVDYYWSCSGGNVYSAYSDRPTFKAPSVSSNRNYTCTLKVTDDESLTDTDSMSILVKDRYDTNNPPEADAGSDRELYENDSITLYGYGYDEEDGNNVDYSWDCTGGYIYDSHDDRPTFKAPSVSSNRYYTCTLTVEDSDGLTDSDSARILVKDEDDEEGDVILEVKKGVKNITRGDDTWYQSLFADPGDLLKFRIRVFSEGDDTAYNVKVREYLPDEIDFTGDLEVDEEDIEKDISEEDIEIGDIDPGDSIVVTFYARVDSKSSFNYGRTDLINKARVFNSEDSDEDDCKIMVDRKGVAGTDISTGITDNIFNSLVIPLGLSFLLVWLFSSKLINLNEWTEEKRNKARSFQTKKMLENKIAKIRTKDLKA